MLSGATSESVAETNNGDSSPISTTNGAAGPREPARNLVPTLRVGMPSATLRVVRRLGRRASKTAFPRGAWERGSAPSGTGWSSARSLQ